jgi:hypothetical protein
MVTQRCNWSPEPYTVEFFMRSTDGPWGRCYLDHEAHRWRDVVMTYDSASDTIAVTERGVRRAALNRQRNAFWIDGSIRREVAAPQEFHDHEGSRISQAEVIEQTAKPNAYFAFAAGRVRAEIAPLVSSFWP